MGNTVTHAVPHQATVRLLINYRKSHKTVVRVNPRIPLEDLLPAICQKCELDMESTILLRDSSSQEPLDLSQSLNSHDVRELFAKDTAGESPCHLRSEIPNLWPVRGKGGPPNQ